MDIDKRLSKLGLAYLSRFAADESGATAIEYGLIAALVSVAIIGVLSNLGQGLVTVFGKIIVRL